MERACQTVVLDEACLSAARGAAWAHKEHEHAEAQVTVRLPERRGPMATLEPQTRIVPPHAPHAGGSTFGASSVVFHFRPQVLQAAADEIYGVSRFDLRGGGVQDPLIVHLAEAALAEMEFVATGSLLLDSLATILTGRLVRAYAGLPQGRPRRTLLTPRQLRILGDFIESRFDGGPSVRQLGAVIGLGPQRLTALLKASTGLTPHAYVTHLRIVRACRLLKQDQLTLSEIALTLGFVGQSHFGAIFRGSLGMTPRHYRRAAQRSMQPPILTQPPALSSRDFQR
jgi:AraC family transcriptional regulator